MSVHTHHLQELDQSNHSVCHVCGGCTCHTPQLLGMSCAEGCALNPATYDHGRVAPMPKSEKETESDKALKELRRRLTGIDEDELSISDFELRRTALQWVENNSSGVVNFKTKTEMVEKTERFLRTGKFND